MEPRHRTLATAKCHLGLKEHIKCSISQLFTSEGHRHGSIAISRRGQQPYILIKFSEKPYEIKEFFFRRGEARTDRGPPPLDPPLEQVN